MHVPVRPVVAAVALAFAAPAFAQFVPGPNPITGTVGAQTISAGTGTINSGGAISITTNGTALVASGTATVNNNGTIQTSGTGTAMTMIGTTTLTNAGTIRTTNQTANSGRAIDSNSGTANLNLTNDGLISAFGSDAFRVNTAGSSVALTNNGTIQVTNGGQAIDWAAINTGTNTLLNTGTITAAGEDAVRPGQNGTVTNSGTIKTTPVVTAGDASGSDGIDLRTQKTVTVTNSGTIEGRHGIATDGANVGPSSLIVTNNAGGSIQAVNGSGLNVDGVNTSVTANVTNALGATIKGGVLAATTTGDGDGIDVDGVLTLMNSGNVLGLGAKGAGNNAEGVAAGGGTITNTASGQIIGKSNAPNGDLTKSGNGILIDDSNGGNAVAVTKVTNSGLIQGETGFAIKLVGTFNDEVTNNAGGTIHGAGVGTGAALQTGGGADKVINKGAIIGGNGSAIDLQDGDDSLTIAGGAASISGSVSGGTGTNAIVFDLGTGMSFSHSDKISMFATVEAKSGVATIHGANQIDAISTLVLTGGTFGIADAGGANGQTFASLVLGEDSGIDLNHSTSLTFDDFGAITGGKTLAIVDYDFADSPDYVIRFLGNLTTDPDFLELISMTTIDGRIATFNFDGTFTNVTVAEPSTLAAMGLGMVLLGFRSRRKRLQDIKDEG